MTQLSKGTGLLFYSLLSYSLIYYAEYTVLSYQLALRVIRNWKYFPILAITRGTRAKLQYDIFYALIVFFIVVMKHYLVTNQFNLIVFFTPEVFSRCVIECTYIYI